jgi:GT2 family glycosyltransferase
VSVTLSVVIPATDQPPTLAEAEAAVAASRRPADEVLVVTDASLGASDARNAGAARAAGDVLVFVDADVRVHPDALGRIRDAFDADPSLTAVHGSYDDSPSHRSTVSAFRNLLHHHVHQANPGPAETFWTGLGAVRRDAFLAVGGLDAERYPHPSIEDIELGHRLVAAGGRLVLDPTVQGTHLKRWTLRSMVHTDFARRAVPWVALQVRSRRLSSTLNMGWAHRCSAVACVALVLAALATSLLLVALTAGLLVGLNHRLYALLARRLGVARGALAIGLHWLHHLVAVAAVPVGVLLAVRERGSIEAGTRSPLVQEALVGSGSAP